MVDFNELADKAKSLVGEHADQIKSGITKTGDYVGGKIGHDKVNPIEEKAKGLVDKLAGDKGAPSTESPTPPAAQEPPAPAPEPPATPPAS